MISTISLAGGRTVNQGAVVLLGGGLSSCLVGAGRGGGELRLKGLASSGKATLKPNPRSSGFCVFLIGGRWGGS